MSKQHSTIPAIKRTVRLGTFGYQRYRQRPSDEIPWMRVQDLRSSGLERPIGLINGAFDILHAGHMRLIFAAAEHCSSLVCLLDSDAKVLRTKGRSPIIPWTLRASTLKYMPIDAIVEIDNDREFVRAVGLLQPDFRVLSSEYLGHVSRIPSVPVIIVPARGWHTSDIAAKILTVGAA